MKHVDILIIGGATTGSYFARRMAESGASVLVIDAASRESIGTKYDIFHVGRGDFDKFGLPFPEEGVDKAFSFRDNCAYSAFGNHPKPGSSEVIGMHLHEYTLRMNRWAMEAGAEFLYNAAFCDLRYDETGTVVGAEYICGGSRHSVEAKLVADCSGIPSVARRKLPQTSLVENFPITGEDMFYVILRYVTYHNPKDYIRGSRSWTFYKTWEAPQPNTKGAILGIGSNFSFDFAEKIYAKFEKNIALPEHTVDHIERGATPYRRPPYSFVDNGFLVMGDAACLTKPSAGEGVTSAMVQADIAVDVISRLLREGKDLSAENLWPINKRYIDAQGGAFAAQLAMLVGAVATNARENDLFFEKDIIFSKESFQALGEGKELTFSTPQILSMGLKMAAGVLTGRLRLRTIGLLLQAMQDSGKVSSLYARYPETPAGFSQWCAEAEALWASCGTMADHAAELLEE